MASQLKSFDIEKLTGRVYTPRPIVELILNEVGYHPAPSNLPTLIDPSCGDGAFLFAAAERILQTIKDTEVAKLGLERIYGWDIDVQAIEICKQRLSELALSFGISKVNWNISVNDSLNPDLSAKFEGFFDFVVANPPYVRIQHLDIETRKYLINNFRYCSAGSTDIFYAFFELAEQVLSTHGKAGFITPNSFLNSDAGSPLRESWAQRQIVSKIMNFGHHQIFENASTYNAVSFFGKEPYSQLIYENWQYPLNQVSGDTVAYDSLKTRKIWNLDFKLHESHTITLKQICSIHVGIQTLADKVFFIEPNRFEDEFTYFNSKVNGLEYKIENALLRKSLKASKLGSTSVDRLTGERVIWPYPDVVTPGSRALEEIELRYQFPLAYKYLGEHRELLDARDNGEPNRAGWFAFSRQQGLTTQFQRKIVFPPMVEKPCFFLIENPSIVIYSGYFILSKFPLELVLEVLNSPELYDWVKATGRDFRGGWKSMSKKLLDGFPIPERFKHNFQADTLF
jgi:predicted RNA methylase